MKRLSVCIPTYDQPLLTAKHVEGCMNGTVMPDEIIVVNDGGRPEILDELKKVEKKTKIIYARINEDILWNTNGAYNLGMFISTGDILSLEDCDHVPYKDFYEKAKVEIEKGFDRSRGKGRSLIKMAELSKPTNEWLPYKSAGTHILVGMYTRDILLRMKGYDERFGGHYGWNGSDATRRLLQLGCKTSDVSGFYMFSDGSSLQGNRPMLNNKPKMEKENFWQLRRNKNEIGQVKHPILNFTYDIQIL